MAEAARQRDGSFLLIENHCPICAAASACQGLCREELILFSSVLGNDVSVERTDHILRERAAAPTALSQTPPIRRAISPHAGSGM
jgi:predicted ArsR family transcriptional regulator